MTSFFSFLKERKIKISSVLILLVTVVFFNTPSAFSQITDKKPVKTIILDAGHGGKDPGTRKYQLSKDEKDIALDVVLKLGKLIHDSLPDVKIVYTRTTDVFIELKDRHEIANRAKGDLFVSVHVNATQGTSSRVVSGYRYVGKKGHRRKVPTYRTVTNRATEAKGTETYVLGLHRNSQKSKAIESYGDNFEEESGLLNPEDPTTQIVIAQYTQAFLSQSIALASLVQENFEKQGRNKGGVRQMGLEVLAGSTMPGVLVETGFINNAEDEAYLNSEKGQNEIAYSIFKGIKDYKKKSEQASKGNASL